MQKLPQIADKSVLAAEWGNTKEVSALKARIKFRKYGVMRFIGHLDVMRFFQKHETCEYTNCLYRRLQPHMIMSFAQPLGVGLTSDGEYLDIELTESISSEDAVRQLNEVSVEGIEILSFVQISDEKKASGMTIVAAARYEVTCLESKKSAEVTKNIPFDWNEKITDFLKQSEIMVLKKTKKNEREINIRPLIYEINVSEEHIQMFLAAGSEENLKPDLVMQHFFNMPEQTAKRHLFTTTVSMFTRRQKPDLFHWTA